MTCRVNSQPNILRPERLAAGSRINAAVGAGFGVRVETGLAGSAAEEAPERGALFLVLTVSVDWLRLFVLGKVNSTRRGRDPMKEIRWLGAERICQVHLKENTITLQMGQGQMDSAISDRWYTCAVDGWTPGATQGRGLPYLSAMLVNYRTGGFCLPR